MLYAVYGILAVLLIVIDQVTKYLTRAYIPLGDSVTFIPHVMDFTYVKNTGAAFSILREHTWLLTLFSAVIVAVILVMAARREIKGKLGLFTATLIVAGGMGNLIDRVFLGYVTDMLKTTFMEFPVFNFADCCITVGVVLLVIYVLFFYKDDKKEGRNGTDLPADHP